MNLAWTTVCTLCTVYAALTHHDERELLQSVIRFSNEQSCAGRRMSPHVRSAQMWKLAIEGFPKIKTEQERRFFKNCHVTVVQS
ncbi:hypothetical protein BJ166DRAFT_526605 [Pestalotiopsis sp. NC0098]|nr:hypothetical protein BJ166DRAFT_526605 [Pestalotiopsis sp. NC0098]